MLSSFSIYCWLDIQESWRSIVPAQIPAGLRPRRRWCFSSSPKSRKRPVSRIRGSQQEEFSLTLNKLSLLFHLALQLIGWGSPMLGRAIFFTQSTDVNVRLIQNTLTETLWIVFDQIFGHPVVKSRWHINLTIRQLVWIVCHCSGGAYKTIWVTR